MAARKKSLRPIAGLIGKSGAVLLALVSLAAAQQAALLGAPADKTVVAAPPMSNRANAYVAELPDSPGATMAKLQQSASPSSSVTPQQSASPAATPPQTDQSQSSQQAPQRPVGTAAAERTHAAGIAASQPAGVAVAPAKQRRARTIVIKVGALVAAGVAVGTVVALTAATSSKPPGAH